MNLSLTPFSYFGSYLSIAEDAGVLWLRSLHGKSKSHMNSIQLIPLYHGKPAPYKIIADYNQITISIYKENIQICFDGASTLLFKTTSQNIGIRFDTIPKYNFEYNYLLGNVTTPYCIVNSYKNLTKYLVYCDEGTLSLNQNLHIDSRGSNEEAANHSYMDISSNKSGFQCILRDIPTNMLIPDEYKASFSSAYAQSKKDFQNFCKNLSPVSINYKKTQEAAAYVIWSSTVKPEGYLRHYSVYASNKDFPGVWSWDHCFNALGLAKMDAELAWAQMAVIYDYQDELGQIPGSVSDSTLRWNFSKPPVQGYFFKKVMNYMDYSTEQLTLIYKWLSKQVGFYFKYKDSNKDGICEYHHGNDCGEDNSTVFQNPVTVDSPDLTAFLIVDMDMLSKVASILQCPDEAVAWKERADALTAHFHEYFIANHQIVARETITGSPILSGSLLPYVSLILGDRLNDNIKKEMILHLQEKHLTTYGIATESPFSPFYEDDAYWRGPIWAPTTLLLVEALIDCNEKELAFDISKRFCDMVVKYGFAENFDAKTGIGLRDKSFCWTASTFLYLSSLLNK